MGVNICCCDKKYQNAIKLLDIGSYKRTESSNIITGNNNIYNQNENIISMNENLEGKINCKVINQILFNEKKFIRNIIKIQSNFRNYIKRIKGKEKEIEEDSEKEIENENHNEKYSENNSGKDSQKSTHKEEILNLRMNLEKAQIYFSTNSFRNNEISENIINDNIINNEESKRFYPFNIKAKLKTDYKFSGFIKTKLNKEIIEKSNISLKNNEEKLGLIKHGFGKFIFNDGTEFCGIFNENNLQIYGKYSNINQKNKNIGNKNEKEIVITDNLNYEEFIGEYKDYMSEGFGIYKNYINHLKITGIFNNSGLSGIGIEDSEVGGYIYSGEFKNNKKEGYGTIIWKDGNKYKGEFKNNQLNGYGIIEYPGEKYYQGEVKNGRIDGFGEFYWKNEKRYIGNYKNDKRNGFGIYIFKTKDNKNSKPTKEKDSDNKYYDDNSDMNNISAYIGFWKNGNIDGFGMKINNHEIKYGLWENGIKRQYLDNIHNYIKCIDKEYIKLFLASYSEVIHFIENCLKINPEIQ